MYLLVESNHPFAQKFKECVHCTYESNFQHRHTDCEMHARVHMHSMHIDVGDFIYVYIHTHRTFCLGFCRLSMHRRG